MSLVDDLNSRAIELIKDDKPGYAIDLLEAVCALNTLEVNEAFKTRGDIVLEEEIQ